ncbi:hypothetical protein SELMODRAFT_150691 [Selaginella moellendorffii]|uniref:Plastid lipid-associated protein/fibrillin conserved domain-containing protein n=1 Tax=Selaginella moellendorffii TaxID=88036 RepID=D8RX56_SELML|nr:probable plastid-lipid-associated protein 12, chloroplastic isoform X1 [Selaginella moellendorffii]EFJ23198.1 hypothetical protein SELMODRAFT_150691 [Selaginella moellendorffii]|eukprot:XP_002975569.1 probable plastid-lipid-associated protein 12, chloroplastic isoform X1 [Selaginella moellendorffii]
MAQSGVCGIERARLWRDGGGVCASLKNRPWPLSRLRRFKISLVAAAAATGEEALIDALVGVGGRGRSASQEQLKAIANAVTALESEGGIEEPTKSELIEGLWRLMYTTRPSTASPIQRTFVGVDAFTVFQDIKLSDRSDQRVSNTVKFSEKIGELKVEAEASVASSKRINFRFDRAAFSFSFLPFKVPYPVPFRLLGDEAKGWLDTTYLSPSGNIRISRGNKGTTFVLQKTLDPRQRLLAAISSKKDVEKVIEELVELNSTESPAELDALAGKWRLVWSSQGSDANWLQKLTSGLPSWQIVKAASGDLENLVELLPGFLSLKARATSEATSKTRRHVRIQGAAVQLLGGSVSVPLNIEGAGYVELTYLDKRMRISRGNRGSTFVHVRDDDQN